MSRNKKSFSIENNIDKKYFINNLYLKDKAKIKKNIKNIYSDLDYKKNIFHILSKKFVINLNKINLKKYNKYKSVIVIGMGGSTLGANAIYSFLEQKIKKLFIFLDNLDYRKIEKIKKKLKLKKSLFIIISKSGNTIETLVNINLLKNEIRSENTIIITEKKK